MATHLDVLSQAISDVGYWRWWVARFPDSFQIEFGGTQLWNPSPQEDTPPSGVIALRFAKPVSVTFVTHQDAPADFRADWPDLLQNGSIKPLGITYDSFKFNDAHIMEEILACSKQVETRFGVGMQSEEFSTAGVSLSFRAGFAGLIVAAQDLAVLNYQGEISPEEIEQKYVKWWEYWREYWRLRDTDRPLPKDYACEVTIPTGD